MKRDRLGAVACHSAAVAIMAGAFGAHAATGPAIDWLKTGASYQLIHAVAVVAASPRHLASSKLLLGGSLIFAFSLYGLALGGPRWLGAIAPIGGAAMILGWLWMAYCLSLSRNSATESSDTDLST